MVAALARLGGVRSERAVAWLERAWLVTGLLLGCAVLAAGTTRHRLRRPLAHMLLAGVRTSAAVIAGFGLVMSLVELATTGRVTGPDGHVAWIRLGGQGAAALGALLLVGAALSLRHRLRGTCPLVWRAAPARGCCRRCET